MRRALELALVALLLLVACKDTTPTVAPTPRPAAVQPATRPASDLPWGGTAHLEVARSSSCSDLQSWFNAADAQRGVLLDKRGADDAGYQYAFDLMLQADERMRSIGCYD